MIGTREIVVVRLEIDFEILAGEFQTIEEDTRRMSLSQLINVWSPEKRGSRLMLKIVDIEEEKDGPKNKKKMD